MLPWILIAALVGVFALTNVFSSDTSGATELTYSEFIDRVEGGEVKKVEFNKSNGDISGEFKQEVEGSKEFTSSGPADDFQENTVELLREQNVDLEYTETTESFLAQLLPAAAAGAAHRRALRVDEPARPGPDGRGHEHRPEQGEGLQHREAQDDVRRRRGLRRR